MYQSYEEKYRQKKLKEGRQLIRALITMQSRTKETTERQMKSKQDKANKTARLKELNDIISVHSKDLYEKLLAEAKSTDVTTAMKKYSKELAEFKKLSDEHYEIYSVRHPILSAYSKLFKDLSLAIPDFLIYTPTETFFGSKLPMAQLSPKQRAELKVRLKSEGALSNEKFKEKYLKFYSEYISKMDNFDDILFVLKNHPEKFLELNKHAKWTIKNNVALLIKIASGAPGIIEYLPYEMIETIASEKPSLIGSAICRCPEILNNIYPAFFSDFNPKLIFAQKPKREVKKIVEVYLPKFPELEKYLNVPVVYDYHNV